MGRRSGSWWFGGALLAAGALVSTVGCTASPPPSSCDPCAATPTVRPPAPLTTTMTLDLKVGGELPADDVRALLAGASRPCPLTIHRPGNRLGLGVGSVVRFTPTEPAYGRRTTAAPVTSVVTVDSAVTAFIYLGPHVDAAGNPVGAGCRFTGRAVIPNASAWTVQLPDGTTFPHRGETGTTDGLGATFGSG